MIMSDVLTETGLNLPEAFTEDQFFEAGKLLARIEHGMQWAIGDWYNQIPWSDKQKACEEAGLNGGSADQYAQVCRAFSVNKRIRICSFAHHHKLVNQALTQEQRTDLLQKAQENKWNLARLSKERDLVLMKPQKVPVDTFQVRVDKAISTMVDSLPDRTSKKVKRQVESELAKVTSFMQHEYEQAVRKAAKDIAVENTKKITAQRAEVVANIEKERKQIEKAQSRVTFFMSKAEFKLVRSCLHSDTIQSQDAATKLKFDKAFDIFNRLTDTINATDKWRLS